MTAVADHPTINAEYGDRAAYDTGRILEGVVGSTAHGLAVEGTGDRDLMGVYIEPAVTLFGPAFVEAPRNYVGRTAGEGQRSRPGDVDILGYCLRQYLRLVVHGNPSALVLLYTPVDLLTEATPAGAELRALEPRIVSQRALSKYLGYLDNQVERLAGMGRRAGTPNRPELVGAHGYDTKYAGHALRLGLQGLELGETGGLRLPMREPDRSMVLEVRRGQVDAAEALHRIDTVRELLRGMAADYSGPLPEEPDLDVVGRWATATYLAAYNPPRRQAEVSG